MIIFVYHPLIWLDICQSNKSLSPNTLFQIPTDNNVKNTTANTLQIISITIITYLI